MNDNRKLPKTISAVSAVALLLGSVACSRFPSSGEQTPIAESNALPASVVAHIKEGGHDVNAPVVHGPQPSTSKVKASDSMIISTAMEDIRARLKDPDSAEFSNIDVSRRGSAVVVCGYVNANNGFGGKSGRERFIVSGLPHTLETDVEAGGFQPVWDTFC